MYLTRYLEHRLDIFIIFFSFGGAQANGPFVGAANKQGPGWGSLSEAFESAIFSWSLSFVSPVSGSKPNFCKENPPLFRSNCIIWVYRKNTVCAFLFMRLTLKSSQHVPGPFKIPLNINLFCNPTFWGDFSPFLNVLCW